jgi:hypothetical protein
VSAPECPQSAVVGPRARRGSRGPRPLPEGGREYITGAVTTRHRRSANHAGPARQEQGELGEERSIRRPITSVTRTDSRRGRGPDRDVREAQGDRPDPGGVAAGSAGTERPAGNRDPISTATTGHKKTSLASRPHSESWRALCPEFRLKWAHGAGGSPQPAVPEGDGHRRAPSETGSGVGGTDLASPGCSRSDGRQSSETSPGGLR